jgi:hypothetical protein
MHVDHSCSCKFVCALVYWFLTLAITASAIAAVVPAHAFPLLQVYRTQLEPEFIYVSSAGVPPFEKRCVNDPICSIILGSASISLMRQHRNRSVSAAHGVRFAR